MKQLTSCSSTHLLMNAWKSCQYYYLVLTAYSALKKKRIFNVSPADPSSSFNEAVDELLQQLLVEKYIEHDVNTSATCVNCLFCIKWQIFSVLIANHSKSFNEAVDELFQPISGCKCMEHDVNTIAFYFYCPQLLFHTYLMQICQKTNFYLVGYLPRIIGCAKMTQKVLEIIFFCFKHSLTSY